jgi:hypothetical protein
MRRQNPVEVTDTDISEGINKGAGPTINRQGALTAAQEPDVDAVGEQEEIACYFLNC